MTPITLYTKNPHYVQFRGQPTILMASGEHYGALLNGAFDYHTYFDTLARAGLNLTRIFTGTYREIPGEFNIADNMLAPQPADFICPWPQTADGKFDLSRFNDAYFARLHDLMHYASDKGIVVELVFFCFWYNQPLWDYSPLHPANNVQGIGPTDKELVFDLSSTAMIAVQTELVRKLVTVLNGFDNLYYEICNEPYSHHDHSTFLEWQNYLAEVVVETEAALPHRHLIARNVQNNTLRVTDLHPAFSIVNFHYALPEAAHWNYHLNLVLADDETGFAGQSATPYRKEAWQFLLAGGGIYSHLDYSFTVNQPDGTYADWQQTPGYGGPDLRNQLAFLRRFLEEHQVWTLAPHNESCPSSRGAMHVHVMADPGRLYLIYLNQQPEENRLVVNLPAGSYTIQWIDPVACQTLHMETRAHAGSRLPLTPPSGVDDLVLVVQKQAGLHP